MTREGTQLTPEIIQHFQKNRGREYTVLMLANRFRVSREYISKCIRQAEGTSLPNLVRRKEGLTTYYSLPKEEPKQ